MGQQQLLLIVLGIIIVGTAIVVGAGYFDTRMRENDKDMLLNRCVTVATRAVTWKMAGDPFRNPSPAYTDLLEEGLSTLYTRTPGFEGHVAIASATENTLEIVGVSSRYPNTGVRVVIEGVTIVFSEHAYDGSIQVPEELEPDDL